MMVDRRNDVGMKLIVGMMSSVILLFVGFFINSTSSIANEARTHIIQVDLRVKALEENYTNIKSDLVEIKDLLRRKIPTAGSGK